MVNAVVFDRFAVAGEHQFVALAALGHRVAVAERFPVVTATRVENAGAISTDELAEFRSLFGDAAGAANVIVLTGSFPAGVPVDFYRQLVTSAPETARILIDAQGESLRSS